jgi:hypothetical protein
MLSFQLALESIRLLLSSLYPLEAGGRPQLGGWGDKRPFSSFVAPASSQKGHFYENPVLYPIISSLYYPTGQGITPHFDGDRYQYLQCIIVLSPKNEVQGENGKIL